MDHPPVSVVIPAWNAADTLARALASVAAQTVRPAEILVVDDASSDGTAAVAKSHAHLPIRLIRHATNGGGAAALHSGIEAAAHDLVAFLDADDEWLPGKLEAQLALAGDAAVVATGFAYVGRDGEARGSYGLSPFPHEGAEFWRNLLADSAILQSSALVRRRMVLATGGVDRSLRTGYDQQLFVRLARLGPVAFVHRTLVRYHDSPNSLTKYPDPANLLRILDLHRAHIASFAAHLSVAERRRLIARRHAEAATGLLAAGAWLPALGCTARALAAGDSPSANIWRLVTNLPPIRAMKALLRRS